jgi:hypothetical protein
VNATGVLSAKREVVETYLKEFGAIAMTGVMLRAQEKADGVVHVNLHDQTVVRDRALAAQHGSGAPRLSDINEYVLVTDMELRSAGTVDGMQVFLAPYGNAQVRLECRGAGLRDRDKTPKGPFKPRCLGLVQPWNAETGELEIQPIAIFQ